MDDFANLERMLKAQKVASISFLILVVVSGLFLELKFYGALLTSIFCTVFQLIQYIEARWHYENGRNKY